MNKGIPKFDQSKKSLINGKVTELKPSSKVFYLRLDITYLDVGRQCFSDWERDQLVKLSRYIDRMRLREVKDILITPSGSECTKQFNQYMEQFKSRFSEDILPIKQAKHLYVGGGKDTQERLHGFIHANIFYALRLDRKHEINK